MGLCAHRDVPHQDETGWTRPCQSESLAVLGRRARVHRALALPSILSLLALACGPAAHPRSEPTIGSAPTLRCLPLESPSRVGAEIDVQELCAALLEPLATDDADAFLAQVAPFVAVSPTLLPDPSPTETERRSTVRARIASAGGLRSWLGIDGDVVVRVEHDCSGCRRQLITFRLVSEGEISFVVEGRRIIAITLAVRDR